jgi:predicted transcriptional regulator of viral defense system
METKNTILSQKDALLIEDLIVAYGRIVSFDQVKEVFSKKYTETSLKRRVSFLTKLGWFVRLKKGLYAIVTDIGSLSANDISVYTLCQALNKDSYVSFENALRYHGMFDQMLSGVGGVTFRRARTYNVKGTQIRFFQIKKELYFGFSEERADMGLVAIAEKEKALLDILYFRLNQYYINLVWEKLKEHKDIIDFERLKRYALKFNLGIARKVGFFLDCLEIETENLHKVVSGAKSYSKMTNESKNFNAKWRLYVEDSIAQ